MNRCIRRSCYEMTSGVTCSQKCWKLYVEEQEQNASVPDMSAPCSVCPFSKEEPYLAMRPLILEQMLLKSGTPRLCTAANLHCGLRKQCKGQQIARSGGDDSIWSSDEFRKVMPVDGDTGAVVYLRRLMGYFPEDRAMVNSVGDVVWEKTNCPIETQAGLPVDKGLDQDLKRSFCVSFNNMVKVGLKLKEDQMLEQQFLTAKVI